ncbi:MAG: hypothetical protein Q9M82_05315, partial [Mariprofundus sp.]|nr:hypothetical protein [Mariprofundus sp.]
RNLNGAETKSTLAQIMATYGMGHDYRIGANYAVNKKTPTGLASVKQTATALWAWANITNGFGVFGRYENTKDDQLTRFKKIRYAGGVEYSPTKHVTLALALDHTKTTLGGLNAGKTDRIGLWTQTKF